MMVWELHIPAYSSGDAAASGAARFVVANNVGETPQVKHSGPIRWRPPQAPISRMQDLCPPKPYRSVGPDQQVQEEPRSLRHAVLPSWGRHRRPAIPWTAGPGQQWARLRLFTAEHGRDAKDHCRDETMRITAAVSNCRWGSKPGAIRWRTRSGARIAASSASEITISTTQFSTAAVNRQAASRPV